MNPAAVLCDGKRDATGAGAELENGAAALLRLTTVPVAVAAERGGRYDVVEVRVIGPIHGYCTSAPQPLRLIGDGCSALLASISAISDSTSAPLPWLGMAQMVHYDRREHRESCSQHLAG